MLQDILVNINWVDILVCVIAARCVYMGATKGFVVEFFKFFGMFFAIFVTIHYYVRFAVFLHTTLLIPAVIVELVSFCFLWFFVVTVFEITREGGMFILKTETHPVVNKWGGITLSIFRSILVCSLAFLLIFISGNEYLRTNAEKSMTGVYFARLAPRIYEISYNKFVSKLFPDEEPNPKIIKKQDKEQK